jgi:hypothetical protein
VPDQALRIARIASIAAPEQSQEVRVAVAGVAPAAVAQKLAALSASVSTPTSPLAVAKANPTRGSAHTVFFSGGPVIKNEPVNNTNRIILNEDEGTVKLGNQFTAEDNPDETIEEEDVEVEYGSRDPNGQLVQRGVDHSWSA